MNEHLGNLEFDVRAMITKFKQDLAEGDREWQKYKAKWEQPINIGGRMSSAGGGGGAGGAGMPNRGGTAVAGGPSITGTSNGDVTWRLENAVALHQDRQETTANRSYQRRSRSKYDDPPDFDFDTFNGGDRFLDSMRKEQLAIRAASYRQADLHGELVGARTNGRLAEQQRIFDEANSSYYGSLDRADRRSSMVNELGASRTRGLMAEQQRIFDESVGPNGETLRAGDPSSAKSQSMWTKPIAIRNMLRYTMAGLVVDVMANELANESNYRKAVRIAGMDQGAQAQATLQKIKGGFSAIPLVGGLAYNLLAADSVNQTEGDLALTQQRVGYQDASGSFMSGTRGMRSAAGIALSSPAGFVRRSMQIRQAAGDRSIANMREADELRNNAYFEPTAKTINDVSTSEWDNAMRTGKINRWSTPMDQQLAVVNSIRDGHNKATRDQINNTINSRSAASQQLTTAERTQLGYESDYEVSMAQAQTQRMQTQNMLRPVAADVDYNVASAKAAMRFLLRPRSSNPDDVASWRADQEKARQVTEQSKQSILGNQRDIEENMRWGSARQYNPYTQSVVAFTDRSAETMSEKYAATQQGLSALNGADTTATLITAMQDLTATIKSAFGGGSNE